MSAAVEQRSREGGEAATRSLGFATEKQTPPQNKRGRGAKAEPRTRRGAEPPRLRSLPRFTRSGHQKRLQNSAQKRFSVSFHPTAAYRGLSSPKLTTLQATMEAFGDFDPNLYLERVQLSYFYDNKDCL